MTSRQLDEEAIFHTARKITNSEARTEYLDQICAGDQALRERVEALLEVHEQDEAFLKSTDEPPPTLDQPVTEFPGTAIGRYKLMEQIGEGGMGTVFVAQQERPIRRKVALKVIKPGMDSKAVVARFEAERQALAMMDHPNISKVLDAGTTESGRPYFAMELVKGIPITEYCDKNKLTIRERLGLFTQVCQAIQHAHQKGIIHRDIKPSNVLVTLHDGKPVPKVIDFGVAKALNTRLTDKTIYTEHMQIIGTLMYMSPEQAEMGGLDIDTRSDVYSLGVLLYELLTGTTPFLKAELDQAGFDEQRRMIRETDPPRASQRISSLGETATSIAEHRKTDVRKLHQQVRGDLDWIVMQALEKDRTRRYETANGVAVDVRRFLSDEAIEARPPSAAYRFRKTAARHRVALVTTAIVMLALVAGTAVSIWQRSVAVTEAARANEEARKAREAEEDAVAAEKEAKKILEQWSRLQDAHIELVMEDILVASLLGEPEKAVERLEESRSLPIPNGWHQMMEGQIRIVEGRYAEAVGRLREAERLLGESTAINSMLALAQSSLGQEDHSFGRLAVLQSQQCCDFADHLFRGWALSGYYPEEALVDLREARRRRPASHVALMIQAEALRSLSDNIADPNEALKQAEDVLRMLQSVKIYLGPHPKVQSEMVLAHLTASGRCSEIGAEQRGQEHLEGAQECAEALAGNSADALIARAHLFRRIGNWQQILSDFETLEGRAETQVAFSNFCAVLFYRNREYRKAIEILEDLDKTENNTGASAFRLFAHFDTASKAQLQKACHVFLQDRKGDQKRPGRYHDWVLCQLLGENRLAEMAADDFTQASDDLNKDVWLEYGKFMKGQVSADELIEACSARRFELAHAHFLVAIDYLAQGKRVRAGESFRRVLDTNHYRVYVYWWSEAFLERVDDRGWLSWLPEPEDDTVQ